MFPHGLHVDRDGNVWVTDALASKDGTKGHQVIKLSPDGKVLMRLGTAGVAGGGADTFQRAVRCRDGAERRHLRRRRPLRAEPESAARLRHAHRQIFERRQVHQGVGQARVRAPASSETRMRSRSTRAAGCSSATAATRACRYSMPTASSSPSGSSSGVRVACTSTKTTSCM